MYINTLSTLKRKIQQVDNPTPPVVITTEAACVHNVMLLDYLTSEVGLEDVETVSTDPSIPIDNYCTDNEQHFGMPGGCKDYQDQDDEIDKSDAVLTASRR
jgi:hypothetical protein